MGLLVGGGEPHNATRPWDGQGCGGRHALAGLWIEGQKYFADGLKGAWKDDFGSLGQGMADRYFRRETPISELKLEPAGSEFRKAVWEALCQIPYGEVVTYGELAQKMAVLRNRERMSAQAVGGAVGHNAISIIIPCHRVVGANGSLTGYAGGIDKKIKLLTHEGAYSESFFVPKKSTAP
ncbi:MAG: methylated-DNA--[protein]-cysteine S-methyltransferase [Bilophila wadsworthia]